MFYDSVFYSVRDNWIKSAYNKIHIIAEAMASAFSLSGPYAMITHSTYLLISVISHESQWIKWFTFSFSDLLWIYVHNQKGKKSIFSIYYSDVTWVSWPLKSPSTRLFIPQFVQADNKAIIRAAHYWTHDDVTKSKPFPRYRALYY